MLKSFAKNTKLGLITIIEENGFLVNIILPNSKTSIITVKTKTYLLEKSFFELEEYFDGKRKFFDLPLNPKGTPFQQEVWNEISKITYGKTASYSEIARNINNPNATRAVGNASNKNPLPIIIPCHRVIGKNGNLTGFACGIKIKEQLLKLENQL